MADINTIILESNICNENASPEGPRRVILKLESTFDIVANESTVNWTFSTDGTNKEMYRYLWSTFLWLSDFYGKYQELKLYSTAGLTDEECKVYSQQVIASGTFTVPHNIDGTRSLRVFLNGYMPGFAGLPHDMIYFARSNISGEGTAVTVNLPTIPRTSSVTCTTVEVGRNPTIAINSPSAAFTHTLRYQFGSLSGTIATGVSGGNYNGWSIPTSFLNEIADDKFGEGTIYCDTYSNGSLNGTETYTFRVNIPSTYAPNISPTIKDDSARSLALTGDENKIIQYYNTVTYDIGAFTSTGATIKSHEITCGGQTATTATGTLKNVESNEFKITVTDSRGFTTTETFYKTLVPYVKLTAKLKLESIDTNGTGSVSITGNLFRGSFGLVDNNPVISYRYKASSGDWSAWQEVVYSITNDSYRTEIQFQGLDYKETYLFEAKAVDELMTVEPEQLVVRCMPVYDWNDEDFQFNVPVIINGDLTVTGTITSANPIEQIDDEPGIAPADYIVEQGTVTTGSGNSTANWAYRKWNSGVAECWCRKYISTAVTTAWGNLFVSGAMPHTNITWGVDFIDIPVANITIAPNASGAFLIAGGSTSLTATNTGGYEIARGSALTSAGNFYINYYGIGKWK